MADISNKDEQRVRRIMSRVRTGVVLRDLITFGLGRIWLVLLELFAVVYKIINIGIATQWKTRATAAQSTIKSSNTTSREELRNE